MHKPCKQPFYSLTVSSDGEMRPCCAFRGSFGTMTDSKSLVQAWKSGPLWEEMRKNELAGNWTLPGCNRCQVSEGTGTSRKEFFETVKLGETNLATNPEASLRFLDIAFSNVRNLTCLMCTSQYSSAWAPHEKRINSERNLKRKVSAPWSLSYDQIDELSAHLSDLAYVEIKGGEPLVDKKVSYFLEKLNTINPECIVDISTNFTRIDPTILATLKATKYMSLTVSVDGVGPCYEWMRGFEFTKLEKNILKFLPLLAPEFTMFQFVSTCYNVQSIPAFILWIEEIIAKIDINIVPGFSLIAHDPEYVSPNLVKNPTRAIKSIQVAKEHLMGSQFFSSKVKDTAISELEVVEKSITDILPTEEAAETHRIWHEELVKIRGWDFTLEIS